MGMIELCQCAYCKVFFPVQDMIWIKRTAKGDVYLCMPCQS